MKTDGMRSSRCFRFEHICLKKSGQHQKRLIVALRTARTLRGIPRRVRKARKGSTIANPHTHSPIFTPLNAARIVHSWRLCRPDVRKGCAFPYNVPAILRLCRKSAIGGAAAWAVSPTRKGRAFPHIRAASRKDDKFRKSQITNRKSPIPTGRLFCRVSADSVWASASR